MCCFGSQSRNKILLSFLFFCVVVRSKNRSFFEKWSNTHLILFWFTAGIVSTTACICRFLFRIFLLHQEMVSALSLRSFFPGIIRTDMFSVNVLISVLLTAPCTISADKEKIICFMNYSSCKVTKFLDLVNTRVKVYKINCLFINK